MRGLTIVVGLSIVLAGALGSAVEAAAPAVRQLVGTTLSAVAFTRNPPDAEGELERTMLQAYLRADGSAIVRVWDADSDRYTAPVERRWSLNDGVLCLGLPNRSICAEVHVWGPRIAGFAARPYVMLDGDLQAGNAIAAGR
jgi:hypothetical protein